MNYGKCIQCIIQKMMSNVCSTRRRTRDVVSQVKYATQTIIHDSEGLFNQMIFLIYYFSYFFDIMLMEIPRDAGCLQTSAVVFFSPWLLSLSVYFTTLFCHAALFLSLTYTSPFSFDFPSTSSACLLVSEACDWTAEMLINIMLQHQSSTCQKNRKTQCGCIWVIFQSCVQHQQQ